MSLAKNALLEFIEQLQACFLDGGPLSAVSLTVHLPPTALRRSKISQRLAVSLAAAARPAPCTLQPDIIADSKNSTPLCKQVCTKCHITAALDMLQQQVEDHLRTLDGDRGGGETRLFDSILEACSQLARFQARPGGCSSPDGQTPAGSRLAGSDAPCP